MQKLFFPNRNKIIINLQTGQAGLMPEENLLPKDFTVVLC